MSERLMNASSTRQSLAQIERLTKQVEKEAVRNGTLLLHVEKLTSELTSAGEKEKSLTRNLEMKEEEQVWNMRLIHIIKDRNLSCHDNLVPIVVTSPGDGEFEEEGRD